MANKINQTIESRQKKNKTLLIEQIKKTPIVQIACEKTGVGRSTFYRWMKEDVEFAKSAEESLQEGVSLMSDMAESQLLSAIRDKNVQAIKFWLQNRHPAYMKKLELSGHIIHSEELTPEEKKLIEKALRLALPDGEEKADQINQKQ